MFEHFFYFFLFGPYCKVISYKHLETCKYDLTTVNVSLSCSHVLCCFNNIKKNTFRI